MGRKTGASTVCACSSERGKFELFAGKITGRVGSDVGAGGACGAGNLLFALDSDEFELMRDSAPGAGSSSCSLNRGVTVPTGTDFPVKRGV